MDRMAASSVTEAACTIISSLGNSDSILLLNSVRVDIVRPTTMMRSIPACAKALQIACPMPPAEILNQSYNIADEVERKGLSVGV